MKSNINFKFWKMQCGNPISCIEKINILDQNIGELRIMMQDALDDAILMRCDEKQFRKKLHSAINNLKNSYK